MADYLNNVAAADKYTDAATLGPDFQARNLLVTIANNPALMQFAIGVPGNWHWSDEREFFSIPQSFQVGGVIGVRVRNANPGLVARVLAVLSGPDDIEIASGQPFTGTLSAAGAVTPAPTVLDVARLSISAPPQSIANSVQTAILLNQAYDFNTDAAVFALRGAPSTRFQVSAGGVYEVKGYVIYAANAAGTRYTAVQINTSGSDEVADVRGAPPSLVCEVTFSEDVQLAAGDYVELFAFQSSGGPLNVSNARLTLTKIT